jgi:HAD superfamily phosphatase
MPIVIFDIDGVIRDVSSSYLRALADTVEHFTEGAYRPTTADIDQLKSEGIWNNDWEGSQELVYRYFEARGTGRSQLALNYNQLVAFFQSRYRGTDPENWTGYICQEQLLVEPSYLEQLSTAGIPWGFFSGATRASATYVLEGRLGLKPPVLIAMEDAPGKPDPTGLLTAVCQLESIYGIKDSVPVIYAGDTVADIYTVVQAKRIDAERLWISVGILPPHIQEHEKSALTYQGNLMAAGADAVFSNIQELTINQIKKLVNSPAT